MSYEQFITAVGAGDEARVAILIDLGINPAYDNNAAVRLAAANGHSNIVIRLLRDDRVDPSADDNAAIREAAANGHSAVVEVLLQDLRVNPNARDNQAIRFAAKNGHLRVVELLLQDNQVNPTTANNYALRWAARNGHIAVVELLLQDPRVNPLDYNSEAIRGAIMEGHQNVVQLLATVPGVILHAIDDYIRTNTSAGLNRLARMTYAVPKSETDPSITDEDLLVWAAMFGSVPLVQQLVEQGVDPTFADNTAIVTANEFNQQVVVNYLLTLPNVKL